MELTPGQQRLVFVVVVLALAGLGIYLLNGRESGGSPAAAPSTTPASTAAAPPVASSAASAPASSVPSTAAPSTSAATAGGTDIYQLLPFTPAELSAAANTTTAFAKAYATWSYTESATAYGATFNGLATAKEIGILESNYNSAAAQQTAKKLVSSGSGTIDSIRSILSAVPGQPTSITFLVTINQQVTPAQPGATPSSQYAITVSPQGTAWLVNDIELSKLGNQ